LSSQKLLAVLSVGSPGSAVGLCLFGVGVRAAGPAGGVGDEVGRGGKAGDAAPGLEIGDAAGAAVETGEER
jgi:hypothetical protein